MEDETRLTEQIGEITKEDHYLTKDDLMKVLKVGRSKMAGLLESGEIRTVKVGRYVRIPVSELRRYQAERLEESERLLVESLGDNFLVKG